MGWSSGTDVYLAAADAFGELFELVKGGVRVTDEEMVDAFADFAYELGNYDWDGEDDALRQLVSPSVAYRGLAKAMRRYA